MKKLILPALLMISTISFSQVFIGKVDINQRYLQYLEVWEKPIASNGKLNLMVDFGQEDTPDDSRGQAFVLNNRKGLVMEFNSIIDGLNYMYRNGWEVLNSKNIDGYESFIMKRRDGFIMPTNGMSKN